jgi:hypothetical protein
VAYLLPPPQGEEEMPVAPRPQGLVPLPVQRPTRQRQQSDREQVQDRMQPMQPVPP